MTKKRVFPLNIPNVRVICFIVTIYVLTLHGAALSATQMQCPSLVKGAYLLKLTSIADDGSIVLDICTQSRCGIAITNGVGAVMTIYWAGNQTVSFEGASFAHGAKLVAAIVRKDNGQPTSQIGLIDLSRMTVKQITSTPGLKYFPSMHPKLPVITYAIAQRARQAGATPYADWDIFEWDMSSERQTQLTKLEFFLISRPGYLGQNYVLFSGEAPYLVKTGKAKIDSKGKDWDRSFIYRVHRSTGKAEVYFADVANAFEPKEIAGQESILYVRRDENLSSKRKYQYSIYKADNLGHTKLSGPMAAPRSLVVSESGRMGAYQDSSNSRDMAVITAFDLLSGKEIFSRAIDASDSYCYQIEER